MYDFADEQPNARVKHDAIDSDPIPVSLPIAIPIEGAEIPQIDGLVCEAAAETRHLGEFSMDLHGKGHPDALYRAAGGESREHAGTVFGCPCCGRSVGRVLRVRATVRSAWVAMCAMCAASTLERNPEAMIGGVVRASRKRRGRVGHAGPTGHAGHGKRAAG